MIKVDFISPESIDGVVNSVNGKFGTVELTAEDLGATTKEYVDEKVLEAQTNGVDLSAYATTEYVAEQIAGIEHPTTDLTGYATEEYVDNAVGGIVFPTPDFTGYATETYVDEAIAAIPEVDLTGFYDKEEIDAMLEEAGGSVSVDGTTIIQNDDGTISTALGGSKTLVSEASELFSYEDEVGITRWASNYNNAQFCLSSGIRTMDTSIVYECEMVIYDTTADSTTTIKGFMSSKQNAGTSNETWDLSSHFHTYFTEFMPRQTFGNGYVILTGAQPGFEWERHYVRGFKIITPALYEYQKISPNYIPVGAGFNINANGEIVSSLTNLTGDSINNTLLQATCELYVPSNQMSVGLGSMNTVGGQGSMALGRNNKHNGTYSTCMSFGTSNYHYAYETVGIGENNRLNKTYSKAFGNNCILDSSNQIALGVSNVSDAASTYVLIVGNGNANTYSVGGYNSSFTASNAFTIDWSGNGAFAGQVSSTGADYAEYFEWLDGNPEGEDRVGYIVALDGDKIRKAVPGDEVLGVISGTIAVLGDNYEWQWQGKYLTDDFGRVITDMVEEFGEEGDSLGFFPRPRINPDYNPEEEYIPRAKRNEWDAVGMMGKLFVRDDGKAQPNDYVTVGADGVATVSAEKTNMRMLSRKGDNIIRILMK